MRQNSQDVIHQNALKIALVTIVFVVPFVINFALSKQWFLSGCLLLIVMMFCFHAWSIIVKRRYYFLVTLLGLTPGVIIYLSYALQYQGFSCVLWFYPVIFLFYYILPERFAWLANMLLLIVLLPQAYYLIEADIFLRVFCTLLLFSGTIIIFVRIVKKQQNELYRLSVLDPLTGLYNRVLLNQRLESSITHSRTHNNDLILLSIDIDHFKRLNSTFGHLRGDAILRDMGVMLKKNITIEGQAFRIGGDEFLILLERHNKQEANDLAELIRCAFIKQASSYEYQVTISIGIACLEENENAKILMHRSDKNLYKAKHSGRNQVVTF
ncbi:MAG: GGDEF domain-containing protein [Saccharospirillaceae bacterium]|nr:GGDEF domain-containing protein [Pseudomonadales bacterium]NRB78457.1 GGDEF domain-containing protein [Saccharospirillaceae bacterium]